MRHQKLFMLLVGCWIGGVVFGQDCDKCQETGQIIVLHEDSTEKYIGGFAARFRGNSASRKLHPRSIVFSRLAFEEFYRVNFQNDPNKYSGMNLCLVSFGRTRANGQLHINQMALVMAPRGQDCKIDSSGFVIANNAFDNSMSPTSQGVQYITRNEFRDFGENYEARFRADERGKRLYSRSLFLRKAVCDMIVAYFRDTPDADGLAVYPAVYGSLLEVCGLRDPGQITLVLVPLVKGVPGYSAFKTFSETKSPQFKSTLALNHGSLCPDVCY